MKALTVALAIATVLAVAPLPGRASSRLAGQARGCGPGHSSHRDPANPLDLPHPPGSDPLTGAHFFVDGPRHGSAAGAIARLLGVDPTRYPDHYSWASFRDSLNRGTFAIRLATNSHLRYQVHQLEKIADQPEAQRFSIYSQGGGPGKIYAQVHKIFCYNLQADPGSVPIISTYFLHAAVRSCPSPGQLAAAAPAFKRRVRELVAGTGNHPVVYLLELDAYGSSACMARRGDLGRYEELIRYEVDQVARLPHAVVYLEAGYSDANTAAYTARALNHSDIRRIRGFFTNDTHMNWTIDEVRWANQVSRMTHGAHYIVNTAQNGNGPLRPRNRVRYGNENLCNPPGRALGPTDTTDTGYPRADAFLWTHVPGNSSGCGGGPPAGTFWVDRAVQLAAHANARLGPRFASIHY